MKEPLLLFGRVLANSNGGINLFRRLAYLPETRTTSGGEQGRAETKHGFSTEAKIERNPSRC